MNPNRIVITGTIGSGKSTVSQIIRDLGFTVLDSDKINKELLEKGAVNYQAIKKDGHFKDAFDKDQLDKKKLAKIIFSNKDLMSRLNSISHPNIIRKINEEIVKCKDSYIFIEIPLYFQMDIKFDAYKVIVVRADSNLQIKRLSLRDDIDKDYALKKIKAQEKLIKSSKDDIIFIDNDGNLDCLRDSVKKILTMENIL